MLNANQSTPGAIKKTVAELATLLGWKKKEVAALLLRMKYLHEVDRTSGRPCSYFSKTLKTISCDAMLASRTKKGADTEPAPAVAPSNRRVYEFGDKILGRVPGDKAKRMRPARGCSPIMTVF
jgi:hypothetical protein